jgi:hypothetical protein
MVEALGLEHHAPVGLEPGCARALVVELDPVAVGVGEIDGDANAVVAGAIDWVAMVDQPLRAGSQRSG